MKEMHTLSDFVQFADEKITTPVFGVIIDATRIYYRPQNNKYASMMKIIDPTWFTTTHPPEFAPFVKVLFMSKTKTEVPHAKLLGSIIKFEGGLVRIMQESTAKTLMFSWDATNPICKWSLISENNFAHYAQQKTIYGTHLMSSCLKPIEIECLKFIQSFAKTYITEKIFIELTQNLAVARAQNKEFDVVARIIKINPNKLATKGYTIYKLLDHTDKAYLYIEEKVALDFTNLQLKDFILLKGLHYTDLVSQKIEFIEHGNALVIPEYSSLVHEYQKMMNTFVEGMNLESSLDEKSYLNPYDASVVLNSYLNFTPLRDVTGVKGIYGKKYRIKVFVVDIGPKDIKEWVKGFCPNCCKYFSIKNEDTERLLCRICRKDAKLVYQVQLFVKDKELRDYPSICRLLLYTHNGKGTEFFDNEQPANCYKNEKMYKKLTGIYKMLTHFNVYLDCVVEKMKADQNSFLQICDTIVKYKP